MSADRVAKAPGYLEGHAYGASNESSVLSPEYSARVGVPEPSPENSFNEDHDHEDEAPPEDHKQIQLGIQDHQDRSREERDQTQDHRDDEAGPQTFPEFCVSFHPLLLPS